MKITKTQLKQIIKEEMRLSSEDDEVLVPGYGKLTLDQIRNKLIRMIQEAAEDVQKEPPGFTHFNSGVMMAFFNTLKDHNALIAPKPDYEESKYEREEREWRRNPKPPMTPEERAKYMKLYDED